MIDITDKEAVKTFQRSRTDWLNKPLVADGDVGSKTRWALDIADLGKDREDLIRYVISFQGTEEKPRGSNSGPLIDQFLAYVGVKPGNAWCCAFVCYVLRQFPYLGKPKIGLVRQFAEKFEANFTGDPLPGDLGFIVRADGTGHIFFVIGVSRFEVMTLEGNVSDTGGVGYKVMVGRRDRNKYGYISVTRKMLSLPAVSSTVPDLDGAGDR